jgi:pimeloyl-ACP methyl ester carboxylesterase
MTAQRYGMGLQRERAAGIGFLRRFGGGAADTLVLLHGVGSNAKSFGALMTALPPSISAIAWDAPGYAESAPLNVPEPTPRDYALSLADFLDALSLSRVALAGHSLGALFAASFAAHYPDRVTALALVSPALGYGVKAGQVLPPGVQSRIDEIVELGPAAFAAKRAARLVGDPAARPDVVAAVEEAMGAVHPAGYIQAVRALGAGQLAADAARIAAPAIVAVGAQDQITPPANARTAHAALANATGFYEIPNAGHALPQEQPEALALVLARLVESMAHV